MTTIVYDLRSMLIAADTQCTDSANGKWRSHKIEKLANGDIFLGAGHELNISRARRWAHYRFDHKHRPEMPESVGEDKDDYDFSTILIQTDGTVWLFDGELAPYRVTDEYAGIGSGASYAIGAMDAGATVEQAVRIACNRDPMSSGPVDLVAIPPFCKTRKGRRSLPP